MTQKSAWRFSALALLLFLFALAAQHGFRVWRSEDAFSVSLRTDVRRELVSRDESQSGGFNSLLTKSSRDATIARGPIPVDAEDSEIQDFWAPVFEAELGPGALLELGDYSGLTTGFLFEDSYRSFWVTSARVRSPQGGECAAVAFGFHAGAHGTSAPVICRAFALPEVSFESLEIELDHAPDRKWWQAALGQPDFGGVLLLKTTGKANGDSDVDQSSGSG